ncbi:MULTISPECIES: LysR substrate-binding domain-containing protein [Burkholderia]|uniref:LysR family transcriptional regulator n=1 Tax=Burkholderia savannae TaxID=1637837 RepID=A0ABR5TGU5_9BURK|nr:MULTISPECIES: LysR substrate-binding domain-containing protein [Burkholderia]AOJ70065.1 LysR family transcriptional regulator [Burkholderia savannae]AOJ82038.1 LysR family transcriptional regulator [Burkholderia savannae]AOK48186.1 LysR family transcriptional regulator [Burkholderia sp. MSMB617WGS]KGR97183.1 bacterial regulatory helix-turn-helix, lysR family protein [Burkholderia sp. ABCPW 111]KVG43942.1 LysR family transcriptional regulator [Burkholderia sp. MSMB0265]
MIDLRRLRYFIVVAEELHFGKAAQRLHLAQPPLTRHISALEGELGLRLFDRSTRSVKLTAEGELFLPHARDVLDAVHRAEAASQRAALGKEGKVALGYTSSVPLCDAFGTLIRNFARSFPDIELSLVEASSAQQSRSIKEGLLDIGIGWKNSIDDYEGCRVKTIAAETLVVAVSEECGLADEASLSVDRLADEPFVLFPPGYGSTLDRKAFDLCAAAGFTPRRGPSASQMTTMIALVAAGRGVAIVPSAVSTLRKPGVAYVPLIDDSALIELVLMWREAGLSLAARSFVEWHKAHVTQRIESAVGVE